MITFSGCKINIGLNITERRPDGFHNLESVFYPIRSLCDIVELQKNPGGGIEFSSGGIAVDCPPEKNLCVRAFALVKERFAIRDGARIYLHKFVPTGAGLGGGSANATAVLRMAADIWNLGLKDSELEKLAAELGSDTAFFVKNIPAFAVSRGEELYPLSLDLSGYYILIVKPDIAVSTARAYSLVTPGRWELPLAESIRKPIGEWQGIVRNDFEAPLFDEFPQLADIKAKLYSAGALYASMSGSGSALYGIFETRPQVTFDCFTHLSKSE